MQLIRSALSTALDTTARVLSLTGTALGTAARLLRSADSSDHGSGGAGGDTTGFSPTVVRDVDQLRVDLDADGGGQPQSTAEVIEAVEESDIADRIGRVVEAPETPLLDESPHVRRAESHVEELATRPVAEVIRAIDDLSTDELRQLTEYETSHRNRRRVLQAIERALAPAPSGGSSDREIIPPEAGGVPTSGTL